MLDSMLMAFSLYSRIPVPQAKWNEKSMRWCICFLPLVGAVIGLVFFGVFRCAQYSDLPDTATALLLTAVPLIITGGFHVDGFMDVADALSSYKTREEKPKL